MLEIQRRFWYHVICVKLSTKETVILNPEVPFMSKLKRGFSFFLSLLMLLSLLTVVPFTALGGKAQAKSYANSGTITS